MAYVHCQSDTGMFPVDTTDSSQPYSFKTVDNPNADIPQGAFGTGTPGQYVARLVETHPKFTLVGMWTKGKGLRCLKSDVSIMEIKTSCQILCGKENCKWEWRDTDDKGYVKADGKRIELGSDEKNKPMFLGRKKQEEGVTNGKVEIGVVRKSGTCYVCYNVPEVGAKVEKCQDFQVLCAGS